MSGYRVIWRVLHAALVAAGVLVGLVVLPVEVWVLATLLAVVLGLTAVVGRAAADQQSIQGGFRPVALVFRAVGASLAVVAVLAFAVVLHAGIVLLLILVGASSPRAVGWWRRFIRRKVSPVESWMPAPRPGALTTRQLCQQWHYSYLKLRQAATPAERLRLVMMRQACLDELERRDPDGLRAWLDSAASAGGDPSRFLTSSRSDAPPDQRWS